MKYTVRNADNAFVIPLGIYRSGTGKTIKGSVNVSVMLNADTVQTLIDNGILMGKTKRLLMSPWHWIF